MHEEMIIAEPHCHAVIDEETELVHYQPVACAAGLQRRHAVRIDAVEKFRRVRPLDLDLAERRGIEEPDAVADNENFPGYRALPAFRSLRIAIGSPPQADRLEAGAMLQMPVENRRLPHRLKPLLGMSPGDGAEG